LIWKKDETEENLNIYKEDYEKSNGAAKEELLLRFYNTTAEAKKDAVCAYIKEVLKENVKFLVFAHHSVMMDAISKFLDKENVNYIRIDGSTKATLRTEYIDKFQSTESCRAAVLSLKACNAGITLTAANLVLFAELDWNPSSLAQAESRAHRIGQDKDVMIRYLLAKGTADDVIWQLLNKKQNILSKVGLFNDDLGDGTHTEVPSSVSIEPKISI
jgi:SWI/SNF-related matrix-associated actin-dependent regulator 1 of chromatin subfamily A